MNTTTLEFIRHHADDDVRKLALKGCRNPEVDFHAALQQIAGRQVARKKVPSWGNVEGIVYPPHLSMEQCSSERTARYKERILRNIFSHSDGKHRFVDLTGGFGVDFFFMSQAFEQRVYVEQNNDLCAISSRNFKLLGLDATVVNADSSDYLAVMPMADVVFLDPARRNEQGNRTYGISDCTPDVLTMMGALLRKSRRVVLKLSPMLDWHKAVADLNTAGRNAMGGLPAEDCPLVREVHIVSVMNECKELLVVVSGEDGLGSKDSDDLQGASPRLVCVNLKADGTEERDVFALNSDRADGSNTPTASAEDLTSLAPCYLYEPNASVMKAGCFDAIATRYQVAALSAQSHLFVSDHARTDFPGRGFRILAVTTMNKKELHRKLQGIGQANVTVRNFPLSVAELRKRLKLKDGGPHYLFATTLSDGSHVLIITKKEL